MPRLCSESSRSYPGRSVLHAMVLLCVKIPEWTLPGNQGPGISRGYCRI